MDTLPQGYNLDNYVSAPINVSNYIPAEPVELFPDLWKGEHIRHALDVLFYSCVARRVLTLAARCWLCGTRLKPRSRFLPRQRL